MIHDQNPDEPGKGVEGSAGSRLAWWLQRREFEPSPMLDMLFDLAETLQWRDEPTRYRITTESLLRATADTRLETGGISPDEVAIDTIGTILMNGGVQRLARRAGRFETPDDDERPLPEPSYFSPNVERSLELACARARERREGTRTLTAIDFLAIFPPEGSGAARMLGELGLEPSYLHGLVEAVESRASSVESPPAAGEDADNGGTDKPARTPPYNDSVATHADEPALIDQLERGPFAAVLARNIIEARASGETQASAFIVHLHGPWGAGKSSVLNFLEAKLKAAREPWLVVRFNAWRDQRRQPPWWSLITCIYAGARNNLEPRTSDRLWWRWFKWRVRADFMPWAVSAALVLVCVALLVLGVTSSIGPAVSAIGTALTLLGAGAVAVRSLALGSQRAAQTYAELKADPFQPMTTLFDRLIAEIERPVAVFIDDLDRCDSSYVVELLEGVQTLMRSAPVTYVVAADRKWICSSFEQKYAKFSPPIGEPGRPLGYLFLDKIFQVSAAVPQLAADVRTTYWQSLLKVSRQETGGGAGDAEAQRKTAEEARRAADEKARAALAGLTTHEQLASAVERSEESEDPIAIQATRAEAAMIITSAAASAQAEHRLKDYAHLLEPNPRAMKRLVNAYGMHQATLFLAGRAASPDALARWTILELRWPLLADFLATRPNYLDRVRKPLADNELKQVPAALRELFGDELVVEVVGEEAAERRLNPDELRAILGAVQGDR